MGEKLSFYRLVSEKNYTIEIPIIQRDYAQGRESVGELRMQFLNALKDYLCGDKSIELDFIYGSLIEDGGRTIFTPLDGQQRLTTLFLLHWYLAVKEGRIKEFREAMLNHSKIKFSYETRITSRDFCSALVSNEISFSDIGKSSVREIIEDSNWFFQSWESDPTILSMLVVLDGIHSVFANTEGFYDKLIRSDYPIICFQFIELENFGLTDSLYVKMNSRGKELTEFENFKAKFEQYLEKADLENGTDFKADFSKKIDTDWTDLFWNYKDEKTNLFDNQLMNFIRTLTINNYALVETNKDVIEDNIDELIYGKASFRQYEALNCLDGQCLQDIIYTLDYLKNGTKGIKAFLSKGALFDEERLFLDAIYNTLTYENRVLFFGLYKYLIINKGDSKGLYDWLRIIKNLSVNTAYNDAQDFVRSIKAVAQLLPYSADIIKHFTIPDLKLEGFAQIQVLEERIKAILIAKNNDWREVVIKYEEHGYFVGQIDFILKFAGIKDSYYANNNLDWDNKVSSNFYKKFNEYAEKSAFMFTTCGLKEFDDHLWQRSLLSKGDYLLLKKRNKSFLVNDNRDIGWKRYLRDDKPQRDFLKLLLDDISVGSAVDDLRVIVENDDSQGWRKYFIQRPEIFNVLGYDKFIRWESENDILLLERSQTNGWHREYYSFALAVRLKSLGNKVLYNGSNSVEYLKFINRINEKNVQISFIYNDVWKYSFKIAEENYVYFDTEDEIIDYLTQNNYIQ